MKMNTLAGFGALVLMPLAAFAEPAPSAPIAASLAATFGANLSTVDVFGGEFNAPTTLSIAAASGDRVTASAVATAIVDGNNTSGALAAATTSESNIFSSVELSSGGYESFVTFGDNMDDVIAEIQGELDALSEMLGVAEGDIDALQDAVAALETCSPEAISGTGTGTGSVTVPLPLVADPTITFPISVTVTGTTVCQNPA
jgi:hypothetical protein